MTGSVFTKQTSSALDSEDNLQKLAGTHLKRNVGYITDEEVGARIRYYLENPAAAIPRREDPQATEAMAKLAWIGAPTHREVEVKPHFKVGDQTDRRNRGVGKASSGA
jgi:hypothetical protein